MQTMLQDFSSILKSTNQLKNAHSIVFGDTIITSLNDH